MDRDWAVQVQVHSVQANGNRIPDTTIVKTPLIEPSV